MYQTLKAEMARKNVDFKDIAKVLGRTAGTVSMKVNGRNRELGFTLDEASKIKDYLGVEMSLEELFEKGE